MAAGTAGVRLGVDIGGTFTDIVLLARDGAVVTKKVSSSTDDYARAIVDGLREVFAASGLTSADIVEVLHGTTVASNAILERRGARTALITTKGFRDILEIRTLRMPRLYDLHWDKPPMLIERRLRFEVDERLTVRGDVERPLQDAEIERIADRLIEEGIEAVAVCLIHAYANPAHERRIGAILARRAPHLLVSLSSDVLPEMREYERTSTTAINAYVMPVVQRYLVSLGEQLKRIGVASPILLMQSNGGLTPADEAARLPVNVIESGPAAGVIGAHALARRMGESHLISFDMGGTTAKASLIERGEVTRAAEYQVGGGIMIGSRLLTGGGYTVRVPAIDLAEVGAGGGSIVWLDRAGALQVGPHSAGAVPGPLCYDAGGTEPTVTDCNVILGYINPEHLIGGALKLNAARAREVFAERIARPLGLSVEAAAHGTYLIAASNMIRAIRAVSTERGRDPRDYALFAFGGNGALFAAGMADTLGIRRVIVPPAPGLFSAFGLLYADVEHHFTRTYRRLVRAIVPAELDALVGELERRARALLESEGFSGARAVLTRSARLLYQGQSFELQVPMPDGPLDGARLTQLEQAFGVEHERTYGHRAGPDEPVELVSVQVVGRGLPEAPRLPERLSLRQAAAGAPAASRRVYFGPKLRWLDTPVLTRAELAGARRGPCIVEEYDATCVVPPHGEAVLDPWGNIVITLTPAPARTRTRKAAAPAG
jgi:N-methylhydantoinase A